MNALTFAASDAAVQVRLLTPRMWNAFCRTLWNLSPEPGNARAHALALAAGWFSQQTAAEATEVLECAGVACGVVPRLLPMRSTAPHAPRVSQEGGSA